ncbi:hypothetical protein BofuT4_P087830.1 [Botrytis cinerea T4]|uniref:Uncharacterized protein n=1 Tax=Botryotinia fuckeliana (strain T4) TaxID=999810 RepID=G2YG22_BOTF4|nr:hypothetical protein BofuT4_P087830.1 [Botrytis cinerea T4]
MPFSISSSLNRLFGHHCPNSIHCPICKTGYFKTKISKKLPREKIHFQSIVEDHYNRTIHNEPRYFKQRIDIPLGQPMTLHLNISKNKHVHEYLCYDWGRPESRNLDFQEDVVTTQEDLAESWEEAEDALPTKGKRMVIKRDFVITPLETEICRTLYPDSPTRYWKAKHTISREYVDL